MKLPRLSVSFSRHGSEQGDHLAQSPHTANSLTASAQPVVPDVQQILRQATALNATFEGSSLTPDDLAMARRRIASIQLAWQDLQSNLEEDRLVLQAARRAQLLGILRELERDGSTEVIAPETVIVSTRGEEARA